MCFLGPVLQHNGSDMKQRRLLRQMNRVEVVAPLQLPVHTLYQLVAARCIFNETIRHQPLFFSSSMFELRSPSQISTYISTVTVQCLHHFTKEN